MKIRCLTKNDIFFCGLGFGIEKTNYLSEPGVACGAQDCDLENLLKAKTLWHSNI